MQHTLSSLSGLILCTSECGDTVLAERLLATMEAQHGFTPDLRAFAPVVFANSRLKRDCFRVVQVRLSSGLLSAAGNDHLYHR